MCNINSKCYFAASVFLENESVHRVICFNALTQDAYLILRIFVKHQSRISFFHRTTAWDEISYDKKHLHKKNKLKLGRQRKPTSPVNTATTFQWTPQPKDVSLVSNWWRLKYSITDWTRGFYLTLELIHARFLTLTGLLPSPLVFRFSVQHEGQ